MAEAADLAIDESVRTVDLVVSRHQHRLAFGSGRALGLQAEGRVEPFAGPTGLEGVVRVLKEGVAVAEHDPPAALWAQRLPKAPRQFLAGIVGVGGDQDPPEISERLEQLRRQTGAGAVRDGYHRVDADGVERVKVQLALDDHDAVAIVFG